ncbi:hypothetical protein ACGYLO_16370 [Sulfitobacter sp. 1A13353]|uniref:hypothetical protein n=1 Tax=Sulfitobacter sp. 1A13353 TaxID=3368568 RepID=UPI00374511C6
MTDALDDLRQKLADVICSDRAVDNWQAMPSDYDLADAIITALPGLVKPLEWEVDRNRIRSGNYAIFEFVSGFYLEADGEGVANPFPSLKVAKDVAQAHHTAQIMAALGIDAGEMQEGKDA